MKHGPLALIEEGMPVVVIAPRDEYYKKTISNMQEVIARGAKVLLITNKNKDEVFQKIFGNQLKLKILRKIYFLFLLQFLCKNLHITQH